MFTAKIIDKKEEGATIAITVEFTDGVDTHTEVVRPQDENGFKYFVKQRCESLTTAKALKEADNVGKTVVVDEPVTPKTQAEIDRDAWLVKYYRWVSIKKNLIDTGVLTGSEKQVTDYLADVKATFKPAYINFI